MTQTVMSDEAVAEAFARWQANNPEPTTELRYNNPFQLLAAVVLSAQATDKSVNAATQTLFAVAPDACTMAQCSETEIAAHIRRIGLYQSKARNLKRLAERLCQEHRGEVPNDRAYLESLPGVGRKTANVVLNTLFGVETIAVDTHIFRVSNRMGLAPGKNVREVENGLLARVPKPYRRHAHHWLILHGRYTCTARRPQCDRCLVADLCCYPEKSAPLQPLTTQEA